MAAVVIMTMVVVTAPGVPRISMRRLRRGSDPALGRRVAVATGVIPGTALPATDVPSPSRNKLEDDEPGFAATPRDLVLLVPSETAGKLDDDEDSRARAGKEELDDMILTASAELLPGAEMPHELERTELLDDGLVLEARLLATLLELEPTGFHPPSGYCCQIIPPVALREASMTTLLSTMS
ncbi:hypothetical protein B0H66DRAFT_528633 [Apodospora peruviana]|uniref:Uncharacterized protein n=1 Tax=Apodospora peruviana TaxID=516989 RepID=A0AAE0MGX4_9PEZI|nr:hypothetical protein B0H66DRAFT_528633 [Apodospora peruviana]